MSGNGEPVFEKQKDGTSRAVIREETAEETAAREKAHAAEAARRAPKSKKNKTDEAE